MWNETEILSQYYEYMGTHLKGVHPLFYGKSELLKKNTDEACSSKSHFQQ